MVVLFKGAASRKEENVEVAVQVVMELCRVHPYRSSSNMAQSFSTWQVLVIRVVMLDSAFPCISLFLGEDQSYRLWPMHFQNRGDGYLAYDRSRDFLFKLKTNALDRGIFSIREGTPRSRHASPPTFKPDVGMSPPDINLDLGECLPTSA
jgi:hypothetical protein